MSDIQLSTYVNFQGRAREAMELYQKLLGGNLVLMTRDEQGGTRPAGPGDTIAYSRLDGDGVTIIGVDGHPNYPAKAGDNIALALGGTDKERITRAFDGLAEGGVVKMPLTEHPNGSASGFLMDKFGINWVVNVDKA